MTTEMRRWEPFSDMMTLREAMDRLFAESFVRPSGSLGFPVGQPEVAVDVYETKDAMVVRAAVPGLNPDDLDINVSGDILTIKGETKHEEEIKDEKYHRREFRYGSFCRTVRLPMEVDAAKAEAVCKDGVLTLTFPKPEERKPLTIPVKIKKR